ncbi:MAG: ABC transporter permease subunit [Proteobacteria bacterium]|nr:ABC transporter permease subunit [Pseudomonadota bacterium]
MHVLRDFRFVLPATVTLIVIIVAVMAPCIAPRGYYEMTLPHKLRPPFWQEGGSLKYPLGTDSLGRDILSRMIGGARTSLMASMLSILIGAVVGISIGIVSAYRGGIVDAVLMRVCDGFLSFPMILLALILAIATGPGMHTVVLAIGLVVWARYARVIRSEALSLKERDFVAYARMVKCSELRILTRHLLPNLVGSILVLATLQIGWAIVVEASLSFIGAGIPPPQPSWGGMVAAGREYIGMAWWLTFFPGMAIAITVLAFNFLGDWLRDHLDPKLREV